MSSGKAIFTFKLKTTILIETFTNKRPFHDKFCVSRLQKLVARTAQQNYEVHFVYDHKDEDSV